MGGEAGKIALIIQIETALGLVNIWEVLSADSRRQAVTFGAEDLAASMGAKRTPAGWEVSRCPWGRRGTCRRL